MTFALVDGSTPAYAAPVSVAHRATSLALVFLAATLLAGTARAADPPRYHYRVLGDIGTYANAINAAGQAAVTGPYHQLIWDGQQATDSGLDGWATAINNDGDMAGWAWRPDLNAYRATLYSGGQGRIIDQTLGGSSSWAYGINDSGVVVGGSQLASGSLRAFAFSNGNMTNLGTLGGDLSVATGINNAGHIVGYSNRPDWSQPQPFLYDGSMRSLGAFSGPARANAINDAGQVVGSFNIGGSVQEHAFLYDDGDIMDLGTFGGGYITRAFDINNHGDIVGMGDIEGLAPRAFLYTGGRMIDLNDLADPPFNIPYVSLEGAFGINDAGEIAAVQCWDNGCNAVLLTPVPEPHNWLMLGAGAAVLLGVRRRSRRT